MYLSATTLELLMNSGLSQAKLVEILRSIESDFRSVQPIATVQVQDVTAEKRRAYDRERKRQGKNSGGIPPDISTGNSTGIPPETEQPSRPRKSKSPRLVLAGDTSEPNGSSVGASSKRGTRLPDTWEPSSADVETARREGLTDEEISRAAVEFRNFWCARTRDATKLSWPRTWENRVLELADRKRGKGARVVAGPGFATGGGRGATSFADLYVRRHGLAAD